MKRRNLIEKEKLKYCIALSFLTFTVCLIHLIGDDLERHKPLKASTNNEYQSKKQVLKATESM